MSLFPLSSPVDALREYLSRMDIEMIDLILDKENTYNQLKKEVFLEKLDLIFDEFKKAGDTKLNIFHGECGNCFKRCRGYTLSGNNSSNYLDLLVKENDGEIKDIFYCSELVNYKEFNKAEPYSLSFDPDEAADFVADEDYLLLVHKSKLAIEEWIDFRGNSIDIVNITQWLKRHKDLYEDCIGYFMYSGHSRFFGFYHDLNSINTIYRQRSFLSKELETLRILLDRSENFENELLQWLIKNEETGRSNIGEISCLIDGKEFRNGRILLDKLLKLYLNESDFKVFFEYESYFTRYYNEKLKQYSVFSNEEMEDLKPETEEFNQAFSLKYNIEQRQRSGSTSESFQ